MNTNIRIGFQICISVPIIAFFQNQAILQDYISRRNIIILLLNFLVQTVFPSSFFNLVNYENCLLPKNRTGSQKRPGKLFHA